jgi:hypothetical protein
MYATDKPSRTSDMRYTTARAIVLIGNPQHTSQLQQQTTQRVELKGTQPATTAHTTIGNRPQHEGTTVQ